MVIEYLRNLIFGPYIIIMFKQNFLNSLLQTPMAQMPKEKSVKKLEGNTIYWNIDPNDVAPWTGTSEITTLGDSPDKTVIVFPTEEFITSQGNAKIIVELELDESQKDKIERRFYLIAPDYKILDNFTVFYNIDPNTSNVIIDPSDKEKNKDALHNLYAKYNISPLIITSFLTWLERDLLPAVFKTMNQTNNEQKQIGGSKNYYQLYKEMKGEYVSLKRMH